MNYFDKQKQQLAQYTALILTWNKKINLIGPSTQADIEQRHITDSAQLLPYLPASPATILDVGSGAGLPGIVLAILAPQHTYTLAERDQRKAAFLHTVVHQLGLTNVTVHGGDVKTLRNTYNIITCRAWAELKDILTQTAPLLVKQGCWLLLKGQAYPTELEACGTTFHLTSEQFPSIVSPNSWVVKITLNHE